MNPLCKNLCKNLCETPFSVRPTSADVYLFRWKMPSAWASFTVCDATGEFQIMSDWGQWGFRWDIRHLGEGKTLTEFLAEMDDVDYVIRKLKYHRSEDTISRPNVEATIKALLEEIDEMNFSPRDRNELRGELEAVDHTSFSALLEVGMTNHLDLSEKALDCVKTILADTAGEIVVHEEPSALQICRHALLPVFFKHLREVVLPARKAEKT